MAVDPISLSASIITVANTGFSVGKFLLDRYSSYRNAPDEVLEIAHEVNICGTLMTPLGDKLKTGSVRYNVQFQRSVEGLISNVRTTHQLSSNGTYLTHRNLVRKDIQENTHTHTGERHFR